MHISARHRFILWVVAVYTVVALSWIILSDRLLTDLADIESIAWLSLFKGVFFVLVSSTVFFFALCIVPAGPDAENASARGGWIDILTAEWPTRWLPYPTGVALVLVTLLVRLSLPAEFSSRPLLILYVLPILLAALMGGMGPGIVTTFAAALVACYQLPPFGRFALAGSIDAFQLSLLLVIGLIISLISGVLHWLRKSDRLRLHQLVDINTALRQSEARYRDLFEANPLPMWVYDTDSLAFLAVNDAAIAHYGYSHDEFLAMTIKDIRPAEDVQRLMESLDSLPAGLNAAGLWRHRKQDGSIIDVEISTHTLPFNGRSAKMVLAHDVTERRQAENALRQAHERLRRFVDADIVGILIATAEGDVLEANDYYLRTIGYTREELEQGKVNWRALTPPEWLPADERALEELSKTGVCVPYEKEYLRRDGTRVSVLLSDAMLPDPGEQIVAFALDITNTKQIETALREREVQYRNLADSGTALIWTSAPDRLCNYFNRRWLEFTGRSLEQELGNGWIEGVHPDDFDRCLNLYATAFDRRQPFEIEYRLRHASGEYRWIRDMGTPNYDSAGAFIGYIGYCFDITVNKQNEQERQQLISELEKRNAELERFTYTVSHDLKSPLVTILGFIGQLEQDLQNNATDNIRGDLLFIRGAARQMGELLDNLLKLSRAGRPVAEPQPVDLADLARQVCEQFHDLLAAGRIVVDLPPDLPAVSGDPIRLREVIQNLLENAVKFTRTTEQPRIELSGRETAGELICRVRDNGIGIPAEYQEKVFGLFEKLDPACEGTGIGLALVRRIVEEHGGRVWVESAGTGQGSTFYFTLPVPRDILPT